MSARKILVCLALACCTIAAISAALYFQHAHQLAMSNTTKSVEHTSKLLMGEFEVYLQDQQKAVKLLAGIPQISTQLEAPSNLNTKQAIQLLNTTCDVLDASLCYVMDQDGTVIANNTNSSAPSIIGNNYAFRPYFKLAIEHGQATYMAMGITTQKRGLYFSSQVRAANGDISGVAVIKFPTNRIEENFTTGEGISALIDPNGVVFASTRKEWALKSLWQLSEDQERSLIDSRQFGDQALNTLGFTLMANNHVNGVDGSEYILGSQEVPSLPSWKIIYLCNLDKIPYGIALDSGAAYSFALFLLLSTIAVLTLYRLGSIDINNRLKAEKELQQSEERLKQLIEISSEAILIHHQGRIIDANAMAEKLFGYSQEELSKLLIWEMMDPESIAKARAHYVDNYELPYEVTAMHRNGTSFPIEICAKTSFVNGRQLRVTCVRDITERKEQEQRVIHQAHYDALTGLPNRNLMIDRLNQAIKKAHRHDQKAIVMFLDLDDFKKINDTLGHSTGDQLLLAAGKRLQSTSREGDTLARYGGDEFILILEDIDSLLDAEVVAEKMLRALSQEFILGEQSFYISGSIGIAVYPDDGKDVDQLLQKADTAMYCSKEEGRNTYHFYTPSMNQHVQERLEMEHHLRTALDNNEFYLQYQPIYNTLSGNLIGAEALLRWQNPTLGFVGPDDFIPLAEQTGLILPIGEWVLKHVCEQTKSWLDLGLEDFHVAVNISPRQFRDNQLMPTIRRTLAQTKLPAEALCIEITEGLLIKNDQGTAQTFNELKTLGIHLSLDDFGTGYSALSYLKQFPFNNLKIDRSFVSDLVEDSSDRQLIQATVAMSQGLGLTVIAEGVEEAAQLEFLKQTGCDAVQGYLFSKPLNADVFTRTIVQSATFSNLSESCFVNPRTH